jgi:cell wall-associated NlpC family hydrolase
MSRAPACTFVIALTVLTGACATTGASPRPFPTPQAPSASIPPAVATAATSTAGAKAVSYGITGTALSLRGAPYRNGGTDPSGFDCSGFVQYVFWQNGVTVPRTVTDQFHAGRQIDGSGVEPGDLVFFTTVTSGASHVGIAIGGDEFVHAPSGTGEVRVERLSGPYWSTRFVGARRVL